MPKSSSCLTSTHSSIHLSIQTTWLRAEMLLLKSWWRNPCRSKFTLSDCYPGLNTNILLCSMIISSSMVTVYVGPERTECILHENLLRQKSQHFAEILKVKSDDGLPKIISLPDEDLGVFGHFAAWMYQDEISCVKYHRDKDWEHLLEWCGLELFAKKFGLTDLQEEAAEQYLLCTEQEVLRRPRLEVIKFLYEKSSTDSSIRPLLVERIIEMYLGTGFDNHKFMGEALSCNAAFAQDFSSALNLHHQIKDPFKCTIKLNGKICSIHLVSPSTPTPKKQTRKRPTPGSGDKRLKKNKADDGTPGLHSDAE